MRLLYMLESYWVGAEQCAQSDSSKWMLGQYVCNAPNQTPSKWRLGQHTCNAPNLTLEMEAEAVHHLCAQSSRHLFLVLYLVIII